MEAKTLTSFEHLPQDYEGLCKIHLPRSIHDETGFRNTVEMTDILAGHELTHDQEDYFETLCLLLEEYEPSKGEPLAKVDGIEALKLLLESNDMSATELGKLLGVSRSVSSRILRRERNLTLEHIKTLCERFRLDPKVFLA